MNGMRRAALALYALDEKDRQSILGELSSAEQETLREQLKELALIGFEADSLAPAAQLTPLKPAPAAADPLSRASAADLFSVLQHEPASLVVQVLAAREWPVREALVSMFAPGSRPAILEASLDEVAPARRSYLLEQLTLRLADVPPAPAVPVWQRFIKDQWARWKR